MLLDALRHPSVFIRGNTNATTDVMPEQIPPIWRSLIWGLQMFAVAAPATIVGILAINGLLKVNNVPAQFQLDPHIALVAAGVGTIVWMIITRGKMPNFVGTSFTYIPTIAAITASMVGKSDANPLSYATGAVMLSTIWTLLIAGFIYLTTRGAKDGDDVSNKLTVFTRLVPNEIAVSIVFIIGLSLAGVAVGMISTNIILGLATVLLIALFKYLPKFWGTIPIILALLVMYLVSAALGLVNLQTFVEAPLLRVPNFMLPNFNFAGFVQMAPVSLATSFETLGHILVLQMLLGRPLMKKLWQAMVADGICDSLGAVMGTSGNTTYAEDLGLLAMTRIFAAWVAFEVARAEKIRFDTPRTAIITAVMLIIGVGNLQLTIDGTTWLSGISYAIVVGVIGWPIVGLFEKILQPKKVEVKEVTK
ncbi:MAG: hypothetical protein NT141_00815 [candidate division WWE3 bacterium]|nr:hypothetical protein [candidate division WWE3 bacterium]